MLAKTWLKPNDQFFWFSRSTYSLSLIAKLRLKITAKNTVIVFLPDYFCNEALTLLRKENVKLYFYTIDEELNPTKESIYTLLNKNIFPDLIIQVHYFGKPYNTSFLRSIADKYSSWFIEDATHVMVPTGLIGEHGDFILYSQYKHFPIPEGALLVIHKPILIQNINVKLVIDSLFLIDDESHKKLSKLSSHLIWILKRLFQKYLFNFSVKPILNPIPKQIKFITSGHTMSLYAKTMLKHLIPTIDQRIAKKFQTVSKIQYILSLIGDNQADNINYIPYLQRYKTSRETPNIISIVKEQNDIWRHFPYYLWPDLPPEVLSNKVQHKIAEDLYLSSLFLPIHTSISNDQLDVFMKACLRYTNERSDSFLNSH
tara:strand:- start:662 stop:1774 length:1113 start_codon:yes stop_codon:yes gene_type:complete